MDKKLLQEALVKREDLKPSTRKKLIKLAETEIKEWQAFKDKLNKQ